MTNQTWAGAIRYEGKLGNDWKLTNNLAASWDDIDYYYTWGLRFLEGDEAGNTPYYRKDGDKKVPVSVDKLTRVGFTFAYNTLSIQESMELVGKKYWGNTKHSLLFGLGYTYMRLPRYYGAVYDGLNYNQKAQGGIIDFVNPNRNTGYINWEFSKRTVYTDKVAAAYIQDYMTWGKLNVLASLRFDNFNRNTHSNKIKGKDKILDEIYNDDNSNNALTYRFGLVYNFNKSLNVYASTSNFYKPHRVTYSKNNYYVDAQGKIMTEQDFRTIKPVTGEQYEVGAHYDLANVLSVNLAAYHIGINNVMRYGLGEKDGKRIAGIVGRSTSQGLELDVAYSPVKFFDFTLSYGLTNARVREFSTTSITKYVAAGNYIKDVPLHKLSSWAFGNFDLSKNSRLRLGLGFEQRGKTYTDESNQQTLPAYSIFHALASYRVGAMFVQLNANNLFDSLYYNEAISGNQYIPAEKFNVTLSLGFDI